MDELKQNELMDLFKNHNALLTGHFLLSSGNHSPHYFQCALLFQDPVLGARLGNMVANLFRDDFKEDKVDCVIGPAMGGILLAYEVGRSLGVKAIFAERNDRGWLPERNDEGMPHKENMAIRRGFSIQHGERVLLVEDVLTTGGSIKEVLTVVKQSGAVPVGIGALVDRSGGKLEFPCKYKTLLTIPVVQYPPQDCPLCKERAPLVKPGSKTILKSNRAPREAWS